MPYSLETIHPLFVHFPIDAQILSIFFGSRLSYRDISQNESAQFFEKNALALFDWQHCGNKSATSCCQKIIFLKSMEFQLLLKKKIVILAFVDSFLSIFEIEAKKVDFCIFL